MIKKQPLLVIKNYLSKSLILFIVIISGGLLASSLYAAPPDDFQRLGVVTSGLSGPTGFEFAPDGRIFILERTGNVRVYKNGQLLAQPFVVLPSAATGDRGLTGIAFDPDFDQNNYVYFYYTSTNLINYLVRMNASGDVGTDLTVLYQTTQQSFELHIGGTIQFGLDGKLYLSIGDNGYPPNSQDLTNPHGKILRLNKDGTIPADNPFYGEAGKLWEIWAYGFRNPFRFTIDEVTGRVYEGDVGQNTWEEINFVVEEGNYGWPTCEGTCSEPGLLNPLFVYNHDGQSSAAVAGPIYRGGNFPASYQGRLFVGDYARGFIKALTLNGNGDTLLGVEDFDLNAGSVVDIKEGPDGALYYVNYIPAALYKIVYSPENQSPVANATADNLKGEEPLTVNFSSAGSYDPDGNEITYLWDFDDGTTSTLENPSHTFNDIGVYFVELTVSDGLNESQAIPLVIQVGMAPTVFIGSPIDGSSYVAGETIFYSASAIDGAGFDIADDDISVEIIFHHDTHIHPFYGPFPGSSGSVVLPTTGEPDPDVWYEMQVTATDTNGLFTTETIEIFPVKVSVTYDTNPSGLGFLIDGIPTTTPFIVEQVVNYERELSAEDYVSSNGNTYKFLNWSDGGERTHIINVPNNDVDYIANYELLDGFFAEYYSNRFLSGEPVLTREESEVNFDWGFGSPDSTVPVENFSARFVKDEFFQAGEYEFSVIADDGVRVLIDGNLLINGWVDQPATTYKQNIDLNEGFHEIKVEYYENTQNAVVILDWGLINDNPPPPPSDGSFLAEYWNTSGDPSPSVPVVAPEFSEVVDLVDFDWSGGSPNPLINTDDFVARFSKEATFEDGEYLFSTTSDDGVRVYIDGELVIDKWIDQAPTYNAASKIMAAGTHEIVVEYYERGGGAVMRFDYELLDTTPPPSGDNGLLGEYFNGLNFDFLITSRIDPEVNFDWGGGNPVSGVGADNFSVRWTGQIVPEFGEEYTFYTTTDDGVRLWIDGQLIIDKWIDQSPTEWSGAISLVAGQRYDIKLEYYEKGGGAVSKLFWSSANTGYQPIPELSLFPDIDDSPPPPPPPPADNQYFGEFWNNQPFGYPVQLPLSTADYTETFDSASFDWGFGSPDATITDDHFIMRLTSNQTFNGGFYEFSVTSDDGVMVYLDGELILDAWVDQPATTYSTSRFVEVGEHDLKIEYYERGEDAIMQFSYNQI